MKKYIKNIINNGNIVQRVFLILFLLNTLVGLFNLFTNSVLGEHSKYQYLPYKDTPTCSKSTLFGSIVNQNCDVIIGIGKKSFTKLNKIDYKGQHYDGLIERRNYSDFGLTYQEFLYWFFIGIFLFFSIYIFKSLVFKELLIWILVITICGIIISVIDYPLFSVGNDILFLYFK